MSNCFVCGETVGDSIPVHLGCLNPAEEED